MSFTILDNNQQAYVPTADEIAVAVVESAKIFGVPPLNVVCGYGLRDDHARYKWGELRLETKRARMVAMLVLVELMPYAPRAMLARCLGVRGNGKSYHAWAAARREADWWDDEVFNVVIERTRARWRELRELRG